MSFRRVLLTLWFASLAALADAHPVPFTYLDLRLGDRQADAMLVAHVIDLAHDLGIDKPERLLDPAVAREQMPAMVNLLRARLVLEAGRARISQEWDGLEVLRDRQGIRFHLRLGVDRTPGAIRVAGRLFPYDPAHQTFVNVYEGSRLTHQAILDRHQSSVLYYSGTPQGVRAILGRFVVTGIEHIAIGPDHILFLIGLLLLGGTLRRLLTIVTAFTVSHSITLSLATLGVLTPPARVIEPAIALSIIYVGADNLLTAKAGRDVRAWIALAFGFIHGFGFANVLREIGLPRQALGWSLFSFNVGVEIGQVVIVAAVVLAVAAIARRSQIVVQRLVTVGSVVVMAAGTFWFVQRVFFTGGSL